MLDTIKEIISQTVLHLPRLFHSLPTRRRGVFFGNITVKSSSGATMKCSVQVGYGTRNDLGHFGNDRFKLLGTGFLSPFSGSCLLSTSLNNEWIRAQGAIGYTISRLN